MFDVNILISNGVDVNKSLELFGDMETYNDTVGEFLISAQEKLAKLEEYKNDKDMPNYAIYVHSLKSDARYFGFMKLGEIAYDQELKSKEGDILYIYDHFEELKEEVEKTVSILKKYLNKESQQEKVEETSNLSTPVIESSGEVYQSKTILVADDSNIVRNFVKRIFSDEYQVGMAKDGEETLQLIQANQDNGNIVAILLDLNMPRKDGFAVLEYMQENNLFSKIPVSIISGDSSKATIDKAFTYPIVDMLGKPFTEMDVKRVLERTLYMQEMQ